MPWKGWLFIKDILSWANMERSGDSFLKDIIVRLLVFGIATIFVIGLCVGHGIKAKDRSVHLVDQMIETGNITGKFWNVIRLKNNQITVTRYQRIITLVYPVKTGVRINDQISFIASLEDSNGKSGSLWHPTEVRFHGTSGFKYGVSALSILLVLILGFKHIRFDRRTLSLTFIKRGER